MDKMDSGGLETQALAVMPSREVVLVPGSVNSSCTSDLHWQSKYGSVGDRNSAMVNNDLMSDVTFIVGAPGRSQRIPAHKYVLATASSVFYAMFYGELAESVVEVPDVEPPVFLSMLMYLYCDKISVETDSVIPTLYISKKYMLPYLEKACVSFLHSSLTPSNACQLLCQARLFEENSLIEHCWEVIDAQTELALSSEGMCNLDETTLVSILERETLTCKEMHLFSAAVAWATAECQRRDIPPNTENKRLVLGDAFFLLRIPTMTLFEFANGPAQSGLLTKDETIGIFLHFTSTLKPHINFHIVPRVGLKLLVCHRHCKQTPVSIGCARLQCRVRYDSVKFSVDKRIFLVGFRLFGAVHGFCDFPVKIELKSMGKVVAHTVTSYTSDGTQGSFNVFLKHPVQIEPGICYCGLVLFDGGPLRYLGVEGKPQVTMEKITFKFLSSLDVPDGALSGQIPDLLFYAPNINSLNTNKTQS